MKVVVVACGGCAMVTMAMGVDVKRVGDDGDGAVVTKRERDDERDGGLRCVRDGSESVEMCEVGDGDRFREEGR
ncbi:hypothetical protein Tco_0736223 [Tanacetum coccineum]